MRGLSHVFEGHDLIIRLVSQCLRMRDEQQLDKTTCPLANHTDHHNLAEINELYIG